MGVNVPAHDTPVLVDIGGLTEVASVDAGDEAVELEAGALL